MTFYDPSRISPKQWIFVADRGCTIAHRGRLRNDAISGEISGMLRGHRPHTRPSQIAPFRGALRPPPALPLAGGSLRQRAQFRWLWRPKSRRFGSPARTASRPSAAPRPPRRHPKKSGRPVGRPAVPGGPSPIRQRRLPWPGRAGPGRLVGSAGGPSPLSGVWGCAEAAKDATSRNKPQQAATNRNKPQRAAASGGGRGGSRRGGGGGRRLRGRRRGGWPTPP